MDSGKFGNKNYLILRRRPGLTCLSKIMNKTVKKKVMIHSSDKPPNGYFTGLLPIHTSSPIFNVKGYIPRIFNYRQKRPLKPTLKSGRGILNIL